MSRKDIINDFRYQNIIRERNRFEETVKQYEEKMARCEVWLKVIMLSCESGDMTLDDIPVMLELMMDYIK